MQITVTTELEKAYPEIIFGSLIVKDVANKKKHENLEMLKREREKKIRESSGEVNEGPIIQNYSDYFKKWGKTYPIVYQLKSIKDGGKFPQVSVLVDSMFLAELKNRILTSGHDLDEIQGNLTFDVSTGGEKYLMLNGKEQVLKKNDVLLRDEEGILASILYGPSRRTAITRGTENALYFAWCPQGINESFVTTHLKDILANLNEIFETVTSESHLYGSR
ncbi:MAG: phenylalanine--tRNA ligase beta subunit-related protein [Candidatus Odinarchaeota archaeon]